MKTDKLFYRLFQELPETYFELIGYSASEATKYSFRSEEIKATGLRIDGVFLPTGTNAPMHFVEVFFYKNSHAFSNLFAKVFLWLEMKDPAQDWHACLVFASRSLEPKSTRPYRALLNSEQVTRVYLDELPEANENQLGLGLLEILGAPRRNVPRKPPNG